MQTKTFLHMENVVLTQSEVDFREWKQFQQTIITRTKAEIKKQQAIIREAEGRVHRLENQLETLENQIK